MTEHSNYCDHPTGECLYQKEIARLRLENEDLHQTLDGMAHAMAELCAAVAALIKSTR